MQSYFDVNLTITEGYGIVALAVNPNNNHSQILIEKLDQRIHTLTRYHIVLMEEYITSKEPGFEMFFNSITNKSGKAMMKVDVFDSTASEALKGFTFLLWRVQRNVFHKLEAYLNKKSKEPIEFITAGFNRTGPNAEDEAKYNCYTWSKVILEQNGFPLNKLLSSKTGLSNMVYQHSIANLQLLPSWEVTAEIKTKSINEALADQKQQNIIELAKNISGFIFVKVPKEALVFAFKATRYLYRGIRSETGKKIINHTLNGSYKIGTALFSGGFKTAKYLHNNVEFQSYFTILKKLGARSIASDNQELLEQNQENLKQSNKLVQKNLNSISNQNIWHRKILPMFTYSNQTTSQLQEEVEDLEANQIKFN